MATPGRQESLRLDRRARADAFQVDDLVASVREGLLRIPRFQRGMKWKDGDRLELLDEARGIGTAQETAERTRTAWRELAPSLPLDARSRAAVTRHLDGAALR